MIQEAYRPWQRLSPEDARRLALAHRALVEAHRRPAPAEPKEPTP